MSTVLTINIDGVDRNVTELDVTAHAFGVGTGLVQDLAEKYPSITTNTKYALKLGTNAHNILLFSFHLSKDGMHI